MQCSLEWTSFADTQGSCFEDWKGSHMGFSALLCGRFADSQESRFQASKRSNICSAVLEVSRFADFHELFFKLQNVQIWNVLNCKGVYWPIVRNVIFRLQNVQIKTVPF